MLSLHTRNLILMLRNTLEQSVTPFSARQNLFTCAFSSVMCFEGKLLLFGALYHNKP